MEVQGLQEMAERPRMFRSDGVQQRELPGRRLLVSVLARQGGEPQQAECGRRSSCGDRRVLQVLASRDQRLVVVGNAEEPTSIRVEEPLQERVGQVLGGGEEPRLTARLEQGQEGLEEEPVVLEVGAVGRPAATVGAQQASVAVDEFPQHEVRGVDGGGEVVVAPEHGAGIRERRDHQGVPRGEALVVDARALPLLPGLTQARADPLANLRCRLRPAGLQDVAAGDLRVVRVHEVALFGRGEPRDGLLGVFPER